MRKIAVFASGNGGNFEALVESSRRGDIPAEIDVCICDCPGARVSKRASRLGVDYLEFSPKEFKSKHEYEKMIADELDRRGIELICLAGYMRIVGDELLERYGGRILNIHPSLLPSFKGAHGIRDAFDYGVKIYGVTVHYVDNTLDGGKILDQEAFRYEGSDIEELEEKIHEVEHKLYARAANKFISLTKK
ncbi:MAG: phosphoribosylglycinamide formyltransferase [Clostridium sp.]|nr:phosphoribosylglycinamide formyltransferase [Prevotella sp.]MCM1429200.1 phosphoribosylglycinamide formyltransferase [Clostridium sp.]MCM1475826.1 phosphoribosylglycinamide formyltransferase [Muribaculaceae bacterium]